MQAPLIWPGIFLICQYMSSGEIIVEIMKVNANKNNLLYENFFEITDCSNYCKNYPDSLC